MEVIKTLNEAAKLAQKLGNVEMGQALIDAQQAALELMEQNRVLREENASLRCGRRACWWAPLIYTVSETGGVRGRQSEERLERCCP